jgi:hypothetical protein
MSVDALFLKRALAAIALILAVASFAGMGPTMLALAIILLALAIVL